MSNAWYNRMKFVALVVLPALGSAYFALSEIWGLPEGAKVVGTITVLDTLLGVLLGVSTYTYNKSDAKYDAAFVKVQTPSGETTYALAYETEEQRLSALHKDELLVKVKD